MRVYVVTYGFEDGEVDVEGVFATRELAEKHLEGTAHYQIHECEVREGM